MASRKSLGFRNYFYRNRLSNMKLIFLFLIMVNFACNKRAEKEIRIDLDKNSDNDFLSLYESNTLGITADSLYQNNSFSGSIVLYSELIKRDSLNGEFFYRRGYSYAQFLMFDSAVLDFEKSVKLKYREYDAYYSLGLIHKEIFLDDSLALYHLYKALDQDSSSQIIKNLILDIKNKNSLRI